MVVLKKAALSFFISLLLFACFAVIAFTGLFDLIETRFYNPSLSAYFNSDNTKTAETVDSFFSKMQTRFSDTLKTNAVRRSFLSNQSVEDIAARSEIYRALMESNDGIQWVRFIDAGGTRLHYSSYSPDIMNQEDRNPVYRNYSESDLSFETIAAEEGGEPKYFFDGKLERVLFSFPLYDSFDIYWGTAVFSLSMNAILNQLSSEGRIRIGQDLTLIPEPSGLLFGLSGTGKTALASEVSSIWKSPGPATVKLVPSNSGHSLLLITAKTSQGFFIGRLLNEELFIFSLPLKIILLASFFFTVYLIIFLLFNIRQDPVAVVQNRLKQLQISLIEQYYERKSDADWARWIHEVGNHRKEVKALLKRSVKVNSGKEDEDIDTLVKQSWDELLVAIGGRMETGIGEEKFAAIPKNMPESRNTAQSSVLQNAKKKPGLLSKADAIVLELEEAEELEELEVLEELEGAEDQKAEEIADEVPAEPSTNIPHDDIDLFASQIEFSSEIEPESSDDEPENETIDEFLEIVSPFSDMLLDLSGNKGKPGQKEEEAQDEGGNSLTIEEMENRGLPLLETPFSDRPNGARLETLEVYSEEEEKKSESLDIIREREGIPFVSKDSKKSGTVQNQDFKKLVDSVIK